MYSIIHNDPGAGIRNVLSLTGREPYVDNLLTPNIDQPSSLLTVAVLYFPAGPVPRRYPYRLMANQTRERSPTSEKRREEALRKVLNLTEIKRYFCGCSVEKYVDVKGPIRVARFCPKHQSGKVIVRDRF